MSGELIASGWYDPPPNGIAVLFGKPEMNSRISFRTLRDEVSWPDRYSFANWRDGLMYAYCSAVHRNTGLPADLAVTLYFGKDERIRQHFHNTFSSISKVLDSISPVETSQRLFRRAEEIFAAFRVANSVVSITDRVALDLGHSFPKLDLAAHGDNLSIEQKNSIRHRRMFINAVSDWSFSDAGQFTVEPQLVSLDDKMLPQITYHYLLITEGNNLRIVRDVDQLLHRFDLCPKS
jgi:hypothetical protein